MSSVIMYYSLSLMPEGQRGGEKRTLFKAFPEVDILAGVSFREFGDVKDFHWRKGSEKGNNV